MKKLLFTVCSANHLAHAKTMANSFVRFNPSYTVLIALVDKIADRFSADEFLPHRLIEVDRMDIDGFAEMAERYTVIELNCAMKSFVAKYIFKEEKPDILLYLDSDIWVRDSLNAVEEGLDLHDMLITPHFTTHMPDNDKLPRERDMLRGGIYNAGFMAFKKKSGVNNFIDWWCAHMRTECYYDFAEGMGVDQIWLNLAPVLFAGTGIFTKKGANVAYWNLHERALTNDHGHTMVNMAEPLLFLHISGYDIRQPHILSRHQDRYSLDALPVLKDLLGQYCEEVLANGYERFSPMPCLYAKSVKQSTGIMKTANRLLKPFGIKISGR